MTFRARRDAIYWREQEGLGQRGQLWTDFFRNWIVIFSEWEDIIRFMRKWVHIPVLLRE